MTCQKIQTMLLQTIAIMKDFPKPSERIERLHSSSFQELVIIYPPLQPISVEYSPDSLFQTRTFTSFRNVPNLLG